MANRFGVSALSKSRHSEAYDEEILVDKNIGEFLIKSPDGELMSYSRNARLSAAYCDVKRLMTNINLYGDLHCCNDDSQLPKILNAASNTSLHDVNFTVSMLNAKRAMIYLNYDFLEKSNESSNFYNATYRDNFPITVIATVRHMKNGVLVGTNMEFEFSMTNNPSKNIIYFDGNTIDSIQITGIRIAPTQTTVRPSFMVLNYVGVIVEA
jgi:hypothetical protein